MTRLPIGLEDYWTINRLTALRLEGTGVAGAGVSLDVWQHLFDLRDGTWFGLLRGAYADNLTLVSVDPAEVGVPAWQPMEQPVDEYDVPLDACNLSPLLPTFGFGALTPDLHARLHGGRTGVEAGTGARARVSLHDDFIFSLDRREPGLPLEAVRLVVRVHEHYLGIDLDAAGEDALAGRIHALLLRERELELRSDPATRRIRVSYRRPHPGRLRRMLGLTVEVHEELEVS